MGLKAKNAAKFRQVTLDRKLSSEDLVTLITKHVQQKYPGDDMGREHERQIAISNMRKEFGYSQMSDKYLVKALGIIGLNEQEITIVVNE
jgi:hypothetical protein